MMTQYRFLVLHDKSLIRRVVAKALASLPNVSVASSSVRSNMLAYLLDHYKPNYILRPKAPLTPHETAIFSSLNPKQILSAIPFDEELITEKMALDFVQTIMKQVGLKPAEPVKKTADHKPSIRLTPSENLPADPKSQNASAATSARIETPFKATQKPVVSKPFTKIIFCGASTGGTEALKAFLLDFPEDAPPILITQHMPQGFTQSFAERLNRVCKITVVEATDRELIRSGCAYVAPGHSHLYIERNGSSLYTRLSQEPPVNRHRPSVEVLFLSAASVVGKNAVGVMFTGMGKDGALAMLKMREAGAYNIAQDEATSVVYGMPKEAAFVGAVHEILPLPQIAKRVIELISS